MDISIVPLSSKCSELNRTLRAEPARGFQSDAAVTTHDPGRAAVRPHRLLQLGELPRSLDLAKNILAVKLGALVGAGILKQQPTSDGSIVETLDLRSPSIVR